MIMKVSAHVFLISSCLFILGASSFDNSNIKMVKETTKQNFDPFNSKKLEKYIVTSVLFDPFLKLKEVEGVTGNEAFEGYVKDLTDLLANKVGFDYELRLVKDSRYGRPDSDRQWNGMIGELIRNEADIAIAPLTITNERRKVIDFTIPFMTTGVSVMIKRPSPVDEQGFVFLTPFTKELWLSIIFSCIGVAVVYLIVSMFSSYNVKKHEALLKQSSEKGTLNNKIFNTLRAISQQQTQSGNRSISTKIIASVFCVFVIILIASYTASLSSFLTVKTSSQSPIQKVEDLPTQSDVKYGLTKGGSTQHFFQNSNSYVYSRMWHAIESRKDDLVLSSKEGIEKVRTSNGKYAFILEGVINDYTNEQQPCDTIRLGPNLNSVGYGIALEKEQSLLRERLNAALISMGNDGTLNEIQNRWWKSSSQCEGSRNLNKDLEPITLCKVAGLFYILISGLILGLLVAIGEFCFKSRQENSESKGELL